MIPPNGKVEMVIEDSLLPPSLTLERAQMRLQLPQTLALPLEGSLKYQDISSLLKARTNTLIIITGLPITLTAAFVMMVGSTSSPGWLNSSNG